MIRIMSSKIIFLGMKLSFWKLQTEMYLSIISASDIHSQNRSNIVTRNNVLSICCSENNDNYIDIPN